jgi:hypothetical protein
MHGLTHPGRGRCRQYPQAFADVSKGSSRTHGGTRHNMMTPAQVTSTVDRLPEQQSTLAARNRDQWTPLISGLHFLSVKQKRTCSSRPGNAAAHRAPTRMLPRNNDRATLLMMDTYITQASKGSLGTNKPACMHQEACTHTFMYH